MSPLVSVTFVAWMRRELLQKGIESVLTLSYQPVEILVVDNSPTDEIYHWLLDAYPMVKAIKTFSPLPLPLVRNMLVASARGEYVIFHDDDSRFSPGTDLCLAVDYLNKNPQVACLAFRQGDERGNWNPQFDGTEVLQTFNYIACAVMFRRSQYLSAGGYFEKFGLYGEELILSLGFFGLGQEIHFFPQVSIIHEQIMTGRVKDPGRRYHLADIIMNSGAMLLRAPLPDVLFWYSASLVRSMLQVALNKRRPLVALEGFLRALGWMPAFLRERKPISRHDFRRWIATRLTYQARVRQRIRETNAFDSM